MLRELPDGRFQRDRKRWCCRASGTSSAGKAHETGSPLSLPACSTGGDLGMNYYRTPMHAPNRRKMDRTGAVPEGELEEVDTFVLQMLRHRLIYPPARHDYTSFGPTAQKQRNGAACWCSS